MSLTDPRTAPTIKISVSAAQPLIEFADTSVSTNLQSPVNSGGLLYSASFTANHLFVNSTTTDINNGSAKMVVTKEWVNSLSMPQTLTALTDVKDGTPGTSAILWYNPTAAAGSRWDTTTYTLNNIGFSLDTNGNNIRLLSLGNSVLATITAPYAVNSAALCGQPSSYYLNASNLSAGLLSLARGGTNNATYVDGMFLVKGANNTISSSPYSFASFTPSGSIVGTTNTIAKFTGTNTVGNSNLTDNGTTISTSSKGLTLGTATLTADGGVNINTIVLIDNATELNVVKKSDGQLANVQLGTLTVGGNLIVRGTTTTISSTTLSVADNIITLNSSVTSGAPSINAGFEVKRGASADAVLLWNETTDKWTIGQNSYTGTLSSIATENYVDGKTWNTSSISGGVLAIANGGTNKSTWNANKVVYTTAANTLGEATLSAAQFTVDGSFNIAISPFSSNQRIFIKDNAGSVISSTGYLQFKNGMNSTATVGADGSVYFDVVGGVAGTSGVNTSRAGSIALWNSLCALTGSTLYQASSHVVRIGGTGSTNPVTWLHADFALTPSTTYDFPYITNSTSGSMEQNSVLTYVYQAPDTYVNVHTELRATTLHSNNDISAAGNISAGLDIYGRTKYFDIVHPDPSMPEGSRLIHASVETNNTEVYYRGKNITDDSGLYTIQLPTYFKHLVHKDTITCHLTVIDSWSQIRVCEVNEFDFNNNQLRIMSQYPKTKFSYIVYGIRKDVDLLKDEIIA